MDHRIDLSTAQLDRALGVLVASAAGDALGAGYEFSPPDPQRIPEMLRGLGNEAPGGWTDDTAQAVAIARVAATGVDLRSDEALDLIAQGFLDWYGSNPPDVGVQTANVFRRMGAARSGAAMTESARDVYEAAGQSAGNGSLMRTGPVALAYLNDPDGLVEAAMRISALTHHEDLAQQACAVWCLAIRHTVLNGELPDFDAIAEHAPNTHFWRQVFKQAEESSPYEFTTNGWAIGALQAAWSAISNTPIKHGSLANQHLVDALTTVIRIGHDTDTTAAIAGQLLGARWGASSVPARWRQVLHGWPGQGSDDLERLGALITTGGRPLVHGWPLVDSIDYSTYGPPTLVSDPYDDGVYLGSAPQLASLPQDVDAVVSLCLVGKTQIPERVDWVGFRLVDSSSPIENPQLDSVLRDIAKTIHALRARGQVVFVHCVRAESRTPTAALAYAIWLGHDLGGAERDLRKVLPDAAPNPAFRQALARLAVTTNKPKPE